MSDQNEPPIDPEQPAGPGFDQEAGPEPGPAGHDPAGSVGEEAAKLFAALSDLARERGSDLGATAAHLSDAVKDADAHIGHGEDCRYCPLCQGIRLVRGTSPEVKAHLAVAANSLLQAAAGVLATHVPEEKGAGSPVEHIDLDDADPWDEQ